MGSKRFALISVSNRDGIVEFARTLSEGCGYGILSTGGTAQMLRSGGVQVTEVADVTGAPEILDGRVKTLHPHIHGGILARRDLDDHVETLEALGIPQIDIVVNNLYPFTDQVVNDETALQDAIELIDIGGPAMTRAAAKNHQHVVVLVDPGDYERVAQMLLSGNVPQQERTRLALKAFSHVAQYDAAISDYLRSQRTDQGDDATYLPDEVAFGFRLVARPRYGENPHQSAAVYANPGSRGGIVRAEQLHGISMSYLNYYDADAALSAATDFAQPDQHVVAIVKHANPCGLAVRPDQRDAWDAALAGDPVSAFGGIVAFSRKLEEDTATAMHGLLLDVVLAPDYTEAALSILRRRKRTRVLKVDPSTAQMDLELRTVSGGALAQMRDTVAHEERDGFKVVTKAQPTPHQLDDIWFAWRACRFIRSNAIVLAKNNAMVGMGAGQPNRVTSVGLACDAAGEATDGSTMASDAFFPFPDGIERAGSNGVAAVVQPGGSVNDDAVIAAADELGLTMVFTGTRHFYH